MQSGQHVVMFSIIMPVYNLKGYVDKALDSVLAQTCKDWECICIDDGSNDGSDVVLDKYSNKDSRIKVIHSTNQGPGCARNAGLRMATGHWVGFLDGDDVLRDSCLETCLGVINANKETDAVKFQMLYFPQDGVPEWPMDEPFKCTISDYSESLGIDSMFGSFCGRIYRREKIADVFFPNMRPGQDRAWQAHAMTRIDRMVEISYTAYAYRQREGSTIHSPQTISKVKSLIEHMVYQLDVFTHSSKKVDAALIRYCVLRITEGFSGTFFCEIGKTLQDEVWEYWLSALREIKRETSMNTWNKMAINVVCFSRSRTVAWLLFFVPLWLKERGIHR